MTDLLTLEALAAMLDMTPAHIRDRLSKSRGFPDAIRVGQQLRWRAYLARSASPTRSAASASIRPTPACRSRYASSRARIHSTNRDAAVDRPE